MIPERDASCAKAIVVWSSSSALFDWSIISFAADETMSLTEGYRRDCEKLGIAPESVRRWYHDPAVNDRHVDGPLAQELKRLRRENAELR